MRYRTSTTSFECSWSIIPIVSTPIYKKPCSQRGQIFLDQGDPAQALPYLQAVLAYRQAHEAVQADRVAHAQVWTGVAFTRLARYAEAEALFESGYPVFKAWVFARPDEFSYHRGR